MFECAVVFEIKFDDFQTKPGKQGRHHFPRHTIRGIDGYLELPQLRQQEFQNMFSVFFHQVNLLHSACRLTLWYAAGTSRYAEYLSGRYLRRQVLRRGLIP